MNTEEKYQAALEIFLLQEEGFRFTEVGCDPELNKWYSQGVWLRWEEDRATETRFMTPAQVQVMRDTDDKWWKERK